MSISKVLVTFLVLEIILSLGRCGILIETVQAQQLSVDFYNSTCPSVETLVMNALMTKFQNDKTISAHILRLQFHDCAVTGCDASLLLTGPNSEQLAPPNLNLLGFDIIDFIKAQVEATCPRTVSCADILAMAARDCVELTGGPTFPVPLGRFDSLVSGGVVISGGVVVNIPSADDTTMEAISFFSKMGLDTTDLVVLNGAHTIGVAHCSSFYDRLYNFQNTGQPDPSINPSFLTTLQENCPQGPNGATNPHFQDLDDSVLTFDNEYFTNMAQGHGVMRLDQELQDSNLTTSIMTQMASNQTLFFELFAKSLVKMGKFDVKNSTTGNVRQNCSVVGTPNPPPQPLAPSPSISNPRSPVNSPSPVIAPSPEVAIGPSPADSVGFLTDGPVAGG